MSVDGGSTFNQIYSFTDGESIVDYSYTEQRIAFLTDTGTVYHSRPRSYKVLELEATTPPMLLNASTSRLVFDSTGQLNAIGVDAENGTIVASALPLVSSEKVRRTCTCILP